MTEFITRYQEFSAAINMQMQVQVAAQKRMVDNQTVIESLLKVILLCGKQGLALHGHRHHNIDWEEKRNQQMKATSLNLFVSEQRLMTL